MKYILWQNNYYDILNLSLYEIESGKTKPLQMQLDNPNILKEGTYTLSIYRSEIKKYDFILKYYYDSLIVAKYGFNVFISFIKYSINIKIMYKFRIFIF